MKNRIIDRRLLLTVGIAVAMWAAGAGRASAQGCFEDLFSILETEGPPVVCLQTQTETFTHFSDERVGNEISRRARPLAKARKDRQMPSTCTTDGHSASLQQLPHKRQWVL